ncbi:MAG: hypothetical protein M3Y22_01995 [Pseudomonadota bacterium]|nr:hypothetical protein [Pseudomonadota bacterium]
MPDPVTKSAAADAQSTTKTFTVAPRRELFHNGNGGNTPARALVEGDTVELDVAEGERLRTLGFLVKEDGSSAFPTGGPATVQGVEIKEA